MAENIRNTDTPICLTDPRIKPLIKECRRQEESCLYTSTELYIWLRQTRRIQRIFVAAPIVLGAIATWSVLDKPELPWVVWVTATCALLAGLFPAAFAALKLDAHVDSMGKQAAEFKNLQDAFRQLATIDALGPYHKFEAKFHEAMGDMNTARAASTTPPERCFRAACRKIEAGHYSFNADEAETDRSQKSPHQLP